VFVERELKMSAGEAFSSEDLLAALRKVARVSEPQHKLMRDTYMDTRSKSMAGAGLSGRWRRVGHKGSLQVKPVVLIPDLVLERVELKGELRRGDDPSKVLRRMVESTLPVRLRGMPIPEVVIRSRREVYMVETESGCVAELSLDRSTALLPGRRKGVPFSEVELEYVQGPADGFDELVQVIAGQKGLAPSNTSKHRRALGLLDLPVVQLTAPAVVHDPGDSTDRVARAVCAAQWSNVRSYEPGTRVALDPEYLHKMRVSTRRLRAALRTFDCCFTRRIQDYLQSNLRWLAAVLGEVRDMDVQLLQLDDRRKELGAKPPEGWEHLRAVLDRRRDQALARLREALDSDRYRRLCKRAPEAFKAAPRRPYAHPGRRAVAYHGEDLVTRRARQFRRAAKKCKKRPRPARVHALRIRGKKLRYTCEFFTTLYRPGYRAQVKRLAPFQDVLGLFNDSVVCGDLARQLRDEALAGESTLPAYLYVLGLLDAASLAEADTARAGVARAYKRMGGASALDLLEEEAARAARKERKRQAREQKRRRKEEKQRRRDAARRRRLGRPARRRR